MRDAHLRVWFAPEDIQGGKKLHEQIETAIRVYEKLLIVLSKASLQSEWVMTDLRKARKAERQSGQRKLFPVRLVDFETLRDWECFDADTGKDRSPTRQLPYSPPPPLPSSCANTLSPTSRLRTRRFPAILPVS